MLDVGTHLHTVFHPRQHDVHRAVPTAACTSTVAARAADEQETVYTMLGWYVRRPRRTAARSCAVQDKCCSAVQTGK